MRIAVVDVDDLAFEEQITLDLLPLREAIPSLVVTCYAIPNHLGPVHELRERYPWIVFAQHGFEHAYAECRSWTRDLALALLARGAEMGYAPLFKPPQWIIDAEVEEACLASGVVLHHHADYAPSTPGLLCYSDLEREDYRAIHSHLQANPSTDNVKTHPYFKAEYLRRFDLFQSPLDCARPCAL